MAKRNLLLVDADPRSVRVLEVSLRKAGYSVTTSSSVDDALELVELTEPDMVVSDTQLEGKDGFAFIEAVRGNPQLAKIPFVFLSSDGAVESKVRGLELGASEYLTKPVYIREILTRIHLIFQRQDQEGALRTSKTRFAGSLEDMGLVDLLQTIDVSRKSGVLHLTSGRRRGAVYFADGRLVDAELGALVGEPAIYRFLVWSEGEFEVDFREVRRDDRIKVSTQGILMEGMRRLDEWGRLQEQLPPMGTVFQVNHDELVQRLAEIPDEINDVLRLFDGKRTLVDVVDASLGDDLATLNAVTKLYFEGFIVMGEPPDGGDDAFDGDVLVGDSLAAPRGEEARSEGSSPPGGAEMVELNELSQPLHPPAVSDLTPQPSPSPAEARASAAELRSDADLPSDPNELALPAAPLQEAGQGESGIGILSEPIRRAEPEATPSYADVEAVQNSVPAEPTSDESPAGNKGEPAKKVDTARGLAPVLTPSVEKEAASPDQPKDGGEDLAEERDEMGKRSRSKQKQARRTTSDVVPRPDVESESESNVIRFPGASGGRSERSASGEQAATATALEPATHEPESAAPPAEGHARSDEGREAQGTGQRPLTHTRAEQDAPASIEVDPELLAPHPEDAFLRAEPEEVVPEPDAVETFFSSQPPAPEPSDAWLDISGHHAPDPGTHRARRLTLFIALGAALLIGGFVAYNKLVMPTPEMLGGGSVSLPTPQAWPDELPADGLAEAQEPAEQVAEVEAPAEAPEPADEAQAPQVAVEAPEGQAPEGQAPEAEAPEAADPVAAAYEELIAEARGKGFRRSAEQAYMRALAVKPDGDEALSGLAMWFLNRGKNKQALARAQQAVALQPKNSEGWIVLGAARGGVGDHSGARDAYRECVQQGEGRYVGECRRMLR